MKVVVKVVGLLTMMTFSLAKTVFKSEFALALFCILRLDLAKFCFVS